MKEYTHSTFENTILKCFTAVSYRITRVDLITTASKLLAIYVATYIIHR